MSGSVNLNVVDSDLHYQIISALYESKDQYKCQTIIGYALSQALEQPFFLDQKRITTLYIIANHYFQSSLNKSNIKNIRSPIIQIYYLHSVLEGIKAKIPPVPALGISNPVFLKGKILGELVERGIFKNDFKNDFFKTKTDDDGMIRERINSLLDCNVPPTFLVDFPTLGRGSFQLFVANSLPLDLSLARFIPKNVRSVALMQLSKIDMDLSTSNVLVTTQDQRLHCIDGARILPPVLTGHRNTYLLQTDALIQVLLGPLLANELAFIDKINLNESGQLLADYGIEKSAIRINRVALMILKEAVAFEGLTLRDLLVLTYISDPQGVYTDIGPLPGKETLLYAITEVKEDKDLIAMIDTQFRKLLKIKESRLTLNPYPKGSASWAVWAHYRAFQRTTTG